MAVAAIPLVKVGAMNTVYSGALIIFTANSTDGATVPIGKDERLIFIATNANVADKTLTVAKGDSVNAAAADLVVTVPHGEYVVFELDSSRYGKMSGTNKGKFSITSNAGADVKLMPIQLV